MREGLDTDALDRDAGTRRPKEEVQASQVLEFSRASRESVTIEPLSGTQQAGMRLAMAVGAIIAVVIGFVLWDFVDSRPDAPVLAVPTAGTPAAEVEERNDRVVEDYRAMNEIAVGRATRLFEVVVATTLLPVFTAILGYIFGRSGRATGAGEGGASA